MTKQTGKSHPTKKYGSTTAAEIYSSVGQALSWWEAVEDALLMLFKDTWGHIEPVALETFLVAPRKSRNMMILSAIKHHSEGITEEDIVLVSGLLKELDNLAKMRNQIAHGYVAGISETVDDEVTMEGNFLASSLTPTGNFADRKTNWKYAYTAREIDEWREKIRDIRYSLIKVCMNICEQRNTQ